MSRSFQRNAVVLLILLGAINFADKAIIGLAAGSMIADLHITATQWGLVGSSFYLLFSLCALLGGITSDKIGPKPLLMLLSGLWAIVQLATMWIMNLPLLLASRILLGAAEGPFYGSAAHAVSTWLPPSKRGISMALVSLGIAAGPALLAPLLSLLILAVGWRASFALLGVIGLLWLLGWWRLREPRQVASEAATPKRSISFKELLMVFFTAPVLLLTLVGFAAYTFLSLLVVWVPLYLQQARHLAVGSPLYLFGIFLPWACGGLLQVVLSWWSDRLFRRFGGLGRVIILVGALLVGAVLLGLVAFTSLPLLAILGLGFMPIGVVFALVATMISDLVPETCQGAIQGASVAVYSLGGLLAPAIVGILVQRLGSTQGFAWTWGGLALLLLLAAGALGVCRRLRLSSPAETHSSLRSSLVSEGEGSITI